MEIRIISTEGFRFDPSNTFTTEDLLVLDKNIN